MRKLNKRFVAYATTSLGAHMMNAIFSFYYVKVFMERYHVSDAWFQFSQMIYMIWNAINDPLFGYMQDNINLGFMRSRRHAILYGAPIYALSFLVPWFAWGSYDEESTRGWLVGLHLLTSLCFFDTLFTFVLLAHGCLFTELSSGPEERITLLWYQQMAGLIASPIIFFTEYVSANLEDYHNFQVTCIVVAIFGWICMHYTGMNAHTDYDLQKEEELDSTAELSTISDSDSSVFRKTMQFVNQASFITLVLVNFFMTYYGVCLSNFTKIFYDYLFANEHLSHFSRSIFYGLNGIIPRILIIVATPLAARWGYYYIMRMSMILTGLTGVLFYISGPSGTSLTLYFIFTSILGTSQAFFSLAISDVIDADRTCHNRKYPLSSTAYGFNALITKPAQSFAPMITIAYLNQHGYDSEHRGMGIGNAPPQSADLSQAMFNVLAITPVIVGTLQLMLWHFYPIRNSHKIHPKYDEFE